MQHTHDLIRSDIVAVPEVRGWSAALPVGSATRSGVQGGVGWLGGTKGWSASVVSLYLLTVPGTVPALSHPETDSNFA